MEKPYQPQVIEQEIQQYWLNQASFDVKEDISKEKFYCVSMIPYPSGELHMGHVRNYTIGDVISRYQRMCGKNVLQPMGWDAFGLPAENAALKNQTPPALWTYRNIEQMRKQLKRLGYAIDWRRELTTCEPNYYRWEQWLFIQLFKKGLAYRKNAIVNWDPIDHTVLANEQVIDGRGWRSGALIERREISQWFIKITAYAEELLNGLDYLTGWPEQVLSMQRHWIGRSEGVEIIFEVVDIAYTLSVYTTRIDTLCGVTYLAIAPEHPLAKMAAAQQPKVAEFLINCQHHSVAESAMATLPKKGIATGFMARHPLSQEFIPIWVANYVLMTYGSGAVMAVPAHDVRDFEFAHSYQLPIKLVIQPLEKSAETPLTKAVTETGILINSGLFNGLTSQQAKEKITNYLAEKNQANFKINYRLRDWGVSRQRYWGAPIPMIYCQNCGIVPVAENDLPIQLPTHYSMPHTLSSPLKQLSEFCQTVCPSCHKPAHRETDTFDTFIESAWYYARYTCFDQDRSILDDRVRYWMPVDHYIGGIEHAIMHLLYARFFHKVLRDEGLVHGDEPFLRLLTQGMVLKDGMKMSKSKGNTVSPSTLIEQYGADTIRLFILFASPPEQSLEWSDSGLEGAHRFLKRVWTYIHQVSAKIIGYLTIPTHPDSQQLNETQKTWRRQIHQILHQANQDMVQLQFNTVVAAIMKLFNLILEIKTDSENLAIVTESCHILLRLLAPITPHIAHYLWRYLGFGENILESSWPKVDNKALKTDTLHLVVQINGKLRANIIIPKNKDAASIQTIVLANPTIIKHLKGQVPKKIIYVPYKLINIVI